MNKQKLIQIIIEAIQSELDNALKAAQQAHDTATHDENVAENKYDTLGLEAAYLAHGQSERVAQCQQNLDQLKKFSPFDFEAETPIAVGALVRLIDIDDQEKSFFISPCAGGIKFQYKEQSILTLTSTAPLGKLLLGKIVGDEVELVVQGKKSIFEVLEVR